ncbi:MAG: YgfZ/GcvT domain-containing protein [Candidatus Udaeobacter sp.]
MFDRSLAGKIEVRGPEGPDFLHNLSTNDIRGLPLGGGCEAFFCNERARTLFLTRIYRLKLGGRDTLWIDAELNRGDALLKHLDRHLIAEQVELLDRTSDFAQLYLAGPNAAAVLRKSLGEETPALELHQHMERTFPQNLTAHIRRNDALGITGYDIIVLAGRRDVLLQSLNGAGAIMATDDDWSILRIEAGHPEYSRDYDENRFVIELGRTNAISYTKGCYLGQEPIVMARDRAGFVARRFCGLRASSSIAGLPAKLFSSDEVGIVTSTGESPRLGPIGLGYLRRGFEEPGRLVHVGSPEGPSATVSALPMR